MRLLLLALLLSLPSFSEGAPTAVLVKSTLRGTQSGLTTSGVPIQFQGKDYVLTSSWGILEEETGTCHEVVDAAAGQTYPAKLVGLDWGIGFALLETPGLKASLDLNAFQSQLPSAPNLETHGFSKAGVLEIKQGRVAASKSTRHHFPSLPFAFEIISERMPSTFVGAPVYGRQLEGILSGQWIDVVAGSYARIREWKTNGAELPNHLFVIPIALIRESLQAGLPKRSTFQPSNTKLGDRTRLIMGKYEWQLICPPGAGEPPLDGIGPIGGGDGVGIGGSMKGTETCTTKVSPQSEAVLETPAYFPNALAQDLAGSLQDGESLLVPFLSTRNVGGYLTRVPFFSHPHFLIEIAKGKKSWVLVPEKPAPNPGTTAFEKLVLENARFKRILLDTYPLISPREDDRDDFRFLYTHSAILESLNWRLVRWKDFNSMTSRTSPSDFVKDVVWNGQPLRLVLQESIKAMDDLFLSAGGTL